MMRSSFILIGMFLFATSVRATPEEDHAEAVRALGVTNIVVKNPGYFFYGGDMSNRLMSSRAKAIS